MTTIVIEELSEKLLEETIELAINCLGEDTREDAITDFNATLKDFPYGYKTLVAIENDKIIGCIQCMHNNMTEDIFTISWVCVAEDKRKQGIGSHILNEGIKFITHNFLKNGKGTILLISDTDPAFYEKNGFSNNLEIHTGSKIMTKIIEGK